MNNKQGLTAFIVDDNPTALQTLAEDLRNQPEFSTVHTFASYGEATLPLIEEQPDVLFLDVEVPGKTGLEFLSSIRPRVTFSFKVVFYSGYSDYMIDAIRLSAFDFLLKPYKQSELRTVIDRIMLHRDEHTHLPLQGVAGMPRKIAMQTISELLLITMDQILMLNYSSEQRSWRLTLTDLSTHQLKKGMTAQELLTLDPTLVRVSNTSIINLTYLVAVENATQRCRLCPPYDQTEIIASRRYFSKLKEKFELL